ncbi:MAG: hypothetical protein K8R86_02075 [Bacteroidales bacterium]|nr:hypothetical protein [Bacteroidales bacterium]
MKKVNLFYLLSAILFGAMLVFASCTKEGAPGTNGADGQDGEDGINGDDGTASCILCHDNSQVMFAKINQWEHSIHATGGNFERNGIDCAPCHTSQGFLERMETGEQVTAASISNPNPINCYTCHWIHNEYTPADWALTYTDEVNFWHTGGKAVTEDFEKGNLCANCHQSRVTTPWPVPGSADIYEITSMRYGPHHGPMANLLGGFGGYEVPGSMTYTSSMHKNIEDACVTCHMADAYGQQAGGHVMNVAYEYHGGMELLEAGCDAAECHPEGIADATEEVQEEVHEMLEALHYKLIDLAVSDSAGYLLGDDGTLASSSNPANLSADEAGAFFNFKFVEEDRSGGIHNIKYAKALLNNSLEALGD